MSQPSIVTPHLLQKALAPDVVNLYRRYRQYFMNFAAWLGLTPKNHSTAGKNRLGVITRAGDQMLRSVLVACATAVTCAGAAVGSGLG